MSDRASPPSRELLLEAVRHAASGDWQKAHAVVEDHDGDPLADWIHAVVHRMEGDLENARYWYGRCGRSLRPQLSTAAELQEIESALRG